MKNDGKKKDEKKEWLGQTEESIMAPGDILIIAPTKSAESIEDVVRNVYAGDYSLVCDAVRCTVATDSLDDIPNAIKNLGKKVKLLFSKNRFPGNPESGYRDAVIYVRYDNGMIGEVQFLLKSMLIAREFKGGHELLERLRELEEKYPKPEKDSVYEKIMSEEDRIEYESIKRQMKELYDDAWFQATHPDMIVDNKKRSGGEKASIMGHKVTMREFNERHVRFYLYDAQDIPVVVIDNVPTCMAYNRFFGEWKDVSFCKIVKSGMQISKKEYIKALAKDGKKYPFDARAADFLARKLHDGQFKMDGETPYIEHPWDVWRKLRWSWKIKNPVITSVAFLHDVLEHSDVTEDALEERFSYMISAKVARLTKGKDESNAEYLKRLVESGDNEALVVKCADILCHTKDFIEMEQIEKEQACFARDHHAEVKNKFIEKARDCLAEAQCVFDAVYDSQRVPERVKETIHKEYTELLSKLEKDTEIMKLEILELDKNRPMKEQISFDDYKRQIYLCLRKIQNCSVDCANHFMEEYKDDFQEFYEKDSFTPGATAGGMVIHFL